MLSREQMAYSVHYTFVEVLVYFDYHYTCFYNFLDTGFFTLYGGTRNDICPLIYVPSSGWRSETKQNQALFSNKPSSTFITVKYTISLQSNYCGNFYSHRPVVSP